MKKTLTHELVVSKTRCDNLFLLKNLNLWGNDLYDLKLLRQMPNLEILSLSVNKISSLKEFSNCPKLQELYLRKNNISDLSELRFLSNLSNLKTLWLLDNPCAEVKDYRKIVIKALPNISKLDNSEVTKEERESSMNVVWLGLGRTEEKISESNNYYCDYEEDYSNESKTKASSYSPEKKEAPSQNCNDWKNNDLNDFKKENNIELQPHKVEKEENSFEWKKSNFNQFYDWKKGDKNIHNGGSNFKKEKDFLYESPRNEGQQNRKTIVSPKSDEKKFGPKDLNKNFNLIQEDDKKIVEGRRKNVLCAVLALLKEFDYSELDFLKRDIDRKLG